MRIDTPRALRPITAACRLALAAACVSAATSAWAGDQIDFGNNTTLDYNFTLGYGLGMRTRSASGDLLSPSNINGDDGDRNFQKAGKLMENQANILGEVNLKHDDWGVFVRADAFYDQVYHRPNYNDEPFTVNHSGTYNQFTGDTSYWAGARPQLLAAYVYNTFHIGQTNLNVKVGDQVLAWGESVFFPNIAGAQGPADATKSYVAGAEVKDILLPVPQISSQWQINPDFSLMAYWQFAFEHNQLTAPGSYFSYSDITGPGAQFLIGPGGVIIPRGGDIKPNNYDQWGVGARWRVFGDTEIGAYYLHYNDMNPSVVFSYYPTLQYQQKYFDHIKLTGLSFSTDVSGVNVAGETSYRQGAAVLVNAPTGPTATRGDVWQSNLSAIYTIGPTFLAASQTLVAEVSYVHTGNVTPVYGSTTLANSRNAAAYEVAWTLSYKNVFNGWDLDVPLTYSDDFTGTSALSGALGSLTGVGDHRVTVGVNFTRLSNLKLGLVYAKFLGKPDPNMRQLADRDYVLATATYSF
ncbi:hypothetical protein LMG28688_02109 [Paraburkholderia caffeinitolerans]|uniref:DUF1302 domain-containing protein n=1 Tax=Paraburkholderia caffeinitolerans TaxID=1723730 RepID=A0A6J5FRF4_9BURK|nr:DUF1302 family protein [Paraburkholderia caffeinitolerans]CAB3785789.1 hypothetical protein LMG28688_02109 [Paraburkholderia caffeinitolerans]